MSLPHAILGVLEARPMTGYELTRFFESTARWVWTAPQSQIYPLLRKLEDSGWVEGEHQLRGKHQRRTEYSITPTGLTELRRWLGEPHEEPSQRDGLLLKALFFDLSEPENAQAVLEEHITELQDRIEQWSAHRAMLLAQETPLLTERLKNRPAQDHRRISELKAHVFDYLIRQGKLRQQWCQETLELVHTN
ncbi:PadR family transcriptional regulator [Microbacterium pseudoresistens]|uniref:DNA-binding PadR family transcriptional regulator n=1 Tax=Microbacterium pseudoresistens TaxID=640634 RepID=A0A7Y9JLJ8_9MICO|nr:helix-turn-helix transcriptional regulator [Microbacterium pseudoresistens]NYD53782.1 DNA-binding PadR family transcriptional regulator [Microbacterium pseudoresistens]